MFSELKCRKFGRKDRQNSLILTSFSAGKYRETILLAAANAKKNRPKNGANFGIFLGIFSSNHRLSRMKSGHFRVRLPVFCMGEGSIFVNNLSVASIFPTGFVCTSVEEILS